MSGRDKWVRRFSVDETARHKNGFTIYKITSVLFPISSPEAVTVVCVWKRYSEVRRLHASMMSLHAGLHLRGSCPLPKFSYFRRFQQEVVRERARAIKRVLEFVAEHRLLFTSTEFVNFLQSGHEPPASATSTHTLAAPQPEPDRDETDFAAIPQIPIYEAADVETKLPSHSHTSHSRTSRASHRSCDSLTSLDSLNDDLFDELNKLTVENRGAVKNKTTLPDLIDFNAPCGSQFEDYHTMPRRAAGRSTSRLSLHSRSSVASASRVGAGTEDSYVFEAGHLLNLAARCEDMGDYPRAFECYKSGIEKMLIGVQTDSDPKRRALIKEKTNKYLSYAEEIYKNHLCDTQETLLPAACPVTERAAPAGPRRRAHAALAEYRVLGVLAHSVMLVLQDQTCLAMKVIQKIPNNLTEFDDYFQRGDETRTPVLPTGVPYMVPLHAVIETSDLIFLVLAYAPGERLLDYIRNYKSAPNTPARELNLENVFSEPMKREDNCEQIVETTDEDVENDNHGDEVEALVKNSQKLLRNVDKVLRTQETGDSGPERDENQKPAHNRVDSGDGRRPPTGGGGAGRALPASALRLWAAQLITAVEGLHNAGVVVRDLNSSNVLLGDGGQVLLTYCVGYPRDVSQAQLAARGPSLVDHSVAPELYSPLADHRDSSRGEPAADYDCLHDYWSVGAIMYELLCGVPLSHHHRSVFTSHTLLVLPDTLTVEEKSLLTQLLTYEPSERLGSGGVHEIKDHPYFRHVDWNRVRDSWLVPR